MQIKSKFKNQEKSIFSIIAQLSTQHGAINLGQGFPDFEIDDKLQNLVQEISGQSKNQYAPMPGIPELREILCQKYINAYNTKLDLDKNICITAGATQAIFTAIQAFVHPNDEVIIIEPAYDSYAPSIELVQAKIIAFALDENFKIDWNKLSNMITEKTKMIVINNPHNPTGQTLNKNDLLNFEKIVLENELILLSDEVYEHLIFDGKVHQSVLAFPKLFERSIATFSFGKTFHATGWKMGYAIASQKLMDEFKQVHQWNVFSVNSLMQYVLASYLKNPANYNQLGEFYQKKRDLFQSEMSMTGFKSIPSNGSYFQLYDYSNLSDLDDIAFAEWLIKEHKVACIPISPFYTNNPKHKVLRFCFAKKEETLVNAVKRLKAI